MRSCGGIRAEPVAGPPPVSAEARKGPKPRPLVWLVVLVVVLAGALGTVYFLGQVLPNELAVLSQGQFTLPVPLTILSAAPNVTWMSVRSQAILAFYSSRSSGSAAFEFSWSLASPAPLPVEFAVNVPAWQSSYFVPRPGGSFSYLPAGQCVAPCDSTGIGIGASEAGLSFVYGTHWTFNYSVRLMSRFQGFGNAQFLEIDLSPAGLESPGTHRAAEMGVAAPAPTDLELVGTYYIQSGISITFSTNESAFQGRSFGHSPAAVIVPAGDQGPLSIRLTSSLTWGPLDWEAVSLSSSTGNFTLRQYADLRFGSIDVTLDPATGP